MTSPENQDVRPDDASLDQATGDAPRASGVRRPTDEEVAAATLHRGLSSRASMPSELRARLQSEGEAIVGGGSSGATGGAPVRVSRAWPLAFAACVAVAAIAIVAASWLVSQRTGALRAERELVASLRERIESNETLLTDARSAVERLESDVSAREATITDQERRLAEAAREQTALASRLASATEDLDRARLAIARYEAPVDPGELRQNREKLLDVPGTVRLAWSPFQLPDAPPVEQPDVTGDVVWNDELEQGYLRFVGLDVNDPDTEQYQVWVIDERGMEQKVSGGVFNATAQGEVIVPIEPGIDVGRVALFAVTVENPGGTWVPDLQRRVVVAPREQG